jgi:hypothetical protein
LPACRSGAAQKQYDNEKATSRCKAEYQESSQSCTAKENDCASAEKDTHCAWQRRSQGCKEEARQTKMTSALF